MVHTWGLGYITIKVKPQFKSTTTFNLLPPRKKHTHTYSFAKQCELQIVK